MVDLHSHILPGIDDGAKDRAVALEMLKIAVNDGTTDIVLTPHYIHGNVDNTADIVKKCCEELRNLAREEGIDINLYPGNEIFICPEVPSLLDEEKLCSLNGSRYLLVELPMTIVPEYTEEVLYQIRLRGYVPVIAHPERNLRIGKNNDILRNLVQQGVLSQVNATSITGLYGRAIQKTAMGLIKKGLVHFVSSDAHTCRGRSPKLSKAYGIISAGFGGEKAETLFITNGLNAVNNEEVKTWERTVASKKASVWTTIFRKLAIQKFL